MMYRILIFALIIVTVVYAQQDSEMDKFDFVFPEDEYNGFTSEYTPKVRFFTSSLNANSYLLII